MRKKGESRTEEKRKAFEAFHVFRRVFLTLHVWKTKHAELYVEVAVMVATCTTEFLLPISVDFKWKMQTLRALSIYNGTAGISISIEFQWKVEEMLDREKSLFSRSIQRFSRNKTVVSDWRKKNNLLASSR